MIIIIGGSTSSHKKPDADQLLSRHGIKRIGLVIEKVMAQLRRQRQRACK